MLRKLIRGTYRIYVHYTVHKFSVESFLTISRAFLVHMRPVRPKAREMTLHGGPPGWLEESDPLQPGEICVVMDGSSRLP
jgi:hypothetical protein